MTSEPETPQSPSRMGFAGNALRAELFRGSLVNSDSRGRFCFTFFVPFVFFVVNCF